MISLKKFIIGSALTAALAIPTLAPAPAQAWWARPGWGGWHGGWGWHAGWGWGWRGGVVVSGPVVAPIGVGVPYVAPYRFIPGHYTPYGAYVPPHWGYY